MLFVVTFRDRPDRLWIRDRFLAAHLEWLENHRAAVRIAGSLRADPDQAPLGALWIVQADGRQQVEDLLRTDPFFVQGLRQEYEIRHWSKAFPERLVPV